MNGNHNALKMLWEIYLQFYCKHILQFSCGHSWMCHCSDHQISHWHLIEYHEMWLVNTKTTITTSEYPCDKLITLFISYYPQLGYVFHSHGQTFNRLKNLTAHNAHMEPWDIFSLFTLNQLPNLLNFDPCKWFYHANYKRGYKGFS